MPKSQKPRPRTSRLMQVALARHPRGGPEVKRYSLDTGIVTPGAVTPWKVSLVGAIAQGLTAVDRIGDQITLRGLDVSVVVASVLPSALAGFGMLCLTDDDVSASNALLSPSPLSRPDPTVTLPMGGSGWVVNTIEGFAGAGAAIRATHRLTWRGALPIVWDRAGNLSAPAPHVVGCPELASDTYRVFVTALFTDA